MREIRYTTQFKRDFKRIIKSGAPKNIESTLEAVVNHLVNDIPLPASLRDHALKGVYLGSRECHVRPDVLLIYEKSEGNTLLLIRLGNHSELF